MLLNTFISNNFVGAPAGGGPATFTDTFNRTPEDPLSGGGNWTRAVHANLAGTAKTDGTHAIGNNSGADTAYFVSTSAATFAANQKTTITIGTNIHDISAGVRLAAGGTGYIAYIANSTDINIYKLPAFTSLQEFNSVSTISTGSTVALSATGSATTTLEIFVNGVSQGTVDDSSSPVTSGQPGIHIFGDDTANQIDSLTAVDL